MTSYTVRQHIYRDPHTFVEIESAATIGNKTIKLIGRGFAKRNACDAPSRDIGYEVAMARAVEDVRRQRAKIKHALSR